MTILLAAWAAFAATGPQRIDNLLQRRWKLERLSPAAPVDDAGFLRRIYIDITGRIPPPDVVTAFLADRSPKKRERAVDTLLGTEAYADHWAREWERVLMSRVGADDIVDRQAFREWLRERFARNVGWNAIARELLAASGRNRNGSGTASEPLNPAVNWLLSYSRDFRDLPAAVSRVFLGIQIECARCHDHPTEPWTRETFRRFAASFALLSVRRIDGDEVKGIRRVAIFDRETPALGAGDEETAAIAASPPTVLDGKELPPDGTRRTAFATWATAPANPWFAKAFVNRVWARFLGRGFYEPIDDFRPSNPVTMPEVLDALATDFVAKGYDVKQLIRTICATRAYQLSSRPVADRERAERFWARFSLKPLAPRVLLHSVLAATRLDAQPSAVAMMDRWERELTFAFDVDEMTRPKDYEGTVSQALMLLNGRLFNEGARASSGLALTDILSMPVGDTLKLEALYLRTLSRRPTPLETRKWLAYIDAPRGTANAKKEAFEDLLWALINSSEFVFNH